MKYVRLWCPDHGMPMRWSCGRVLECPHVVMRSTSDWHEQQVATRCNHRFPLTYFFREKDPGIRLDTGTKWWQLTLERDVHQLLVAGLITFPWDPLPPGTALRVAKGPRVQVYDRELDELWDADKEDVARLMRIERRAA